MNRLRGTAKTEKIAWPFGGCRSPEKAFCLHHALRWVFSLGVGLGLLLLFSACDAAVPVPPTTIPTATSSPLPEDLFGTLHVWAGLPCRPILLAQQGSLLLDTGGIFNLNNGGQQGNAAPSTAFLDPGRRGYLLGGYSLELNPAGRAEVFLPDESGFAIYAPDSSHALIQVTEWQDNSYRLMLLEGAVLVRQNAGSNCQLLWQDITNHLWTASSNGTYILIARPRVFPDIETQVFVLDGTLFLTDDSRQARDVYESGYALVVQGASIRKMVVDPARMTAIGNLERGLDLFGNPQSSFEPAKGIPLEAGALPAETAERPGLNLTWLWTIFVVLAIGYFLVVYLIEIPTLVTQLKTTKNWREAAYEISYYLASPLTILGAIILGVLLKPLYYLAALVAAPGLIVYLGTLSGSIMLKTLDTVTGGWQRLSARVSRFAREAPDYIQRRHRDSMGALRTRTEQVMTMPVVTEQVFKEQALKIAQRLGMGENVQAVLRTLATGVDVPMDDRLQAVVALGKLGNTQEVYELACEPAAAAPVRMKAAETIPVPQTPGLAAQAWWNLSSDIEMPTGDRIRAATELAKLVTAHPSVQVQDNRDNLRSAQNILQTLSAAPQTPPDLQAQAATALGGFGAVRNALPILRYLAGKLDNPAAARYLAADGLAQIGKAKEAAYFLKTLAGEASAGDVRLDAVRSLETHSLSDPLFALAKEKTFIQGMDLEVRWNSTQALQRLTLTHEAAECWLNIAQQKEVDADRRIEAAGLAGELGRNEARSVLRTLGTDLAAQSNGDRLRLKAADTLTRLTWISEARPIYLALFSNPATDPNIARQAFEASRKLPS